MKQQWQRLVLRIDALSLRERAIAFAAAALVIITLVDKALFDPLFRQQKMLTEQINHSQTKLAEVRNGIQQGVRAQTRDPDAENRERLRQLSEQLRQKQAELSELQKGLVSPDKMPELLEGLLRRNGGLRLVSLKTLPAANLVEQPAAGSDGGKDKQAAQAATPVPPVYKHGVEIVVQGSYLDMVSYMSQLEGLPWQLFWGGAQLDAEEYPQARLTLTLYTLSLDKKWLNI